MIIIIYTELRADNVRAAFGLPQAERYRAMELMLPVLSKLGEVRPIQSPEYEVDAIFAEARASGQGCVFISFTPPHLTTTGLVCPTIAAFDWAYDTVPDEPRQGDRRHDWPWVIRQLTGVIAFSQHAARTLAEACPDALISCIALPLPARSEPGAQIREPEESLLVTPACRVLDSAIIDLNELAPGRMNSVPLVSAAEQGRCSIMQRIRRRLSRLLITASAPETQPTAVTEANPLQACSDNLKPPSAVKQWRDQIIARSMSAAVCTGSADEADEQPQFTLRGVVYTTVINPFDLRGLFHDTVSAFCRAFQYQHDATLVVYLAHRDIDVVLHEYVYELYKLHPFECRVVLCCGEMTPQAFDDLLTGSHYFVHVSRADGQFLPMLQAMACGVPVISQYTSGMQDYVNKGCGFMVETGWEPTWWPHDPHTALRARHARVNWSSLKQAFIASLDVRMNSPDEYAAMRREAARQAQNYCGEAKVQAQAESFFSDARLLAAIESAVAPEVGAGSIDPRITGLKDAARNGWFNKATGELCPHFTVSADDTVFDLGCGQGAATLFCADIGANVIFSDTDRGKLETLIGKIKKTIARSWRAIVAEPDASPVGRLALADGCVSMVIAMEVLEHLPNPENMLEELVRIGKPGARYLLTVPDEISEKVQQGLAPPSHFQAPNHVQIFSRQAFEDEVRRAGLIIDKRQTFGFFWALWFCFYWSTRVPDEVSAPNENLPTLDQIEPPFDELLLSWAETWQLLMELADGDHVRRALDDLMPKTQVIIARKP